MFIAALDFQIVFDNIPLLVKGLKTTILLCVLGNVLSIIFGTIIGIAKISRYKLLNYLANIYIELFRNTPLLVQVYFFYYGLGMNAFIAGLSGLCAYTSAYMAEIIRAGIQSVSESELKAADALGISPVDKVVKIILPQAFRIIIPPISSQLMNLTKNTSIVYFITVVDVTYIFETLSAQTFKFFEFFIVAVLIYMIMCWLIALMSYLLEKYFYIPGFGSLEMELDH